MVELTDILVHNPECVVRKIDEGLIIMPPHITTAHTLQDLGAFIWGQLDGKRDLATVLATILSEYDVTEELARTDLLSFTGELLEAELVTKADG